MLTEELRHEIEEAAKDYGHRPGACIDALRIVQSRKGWVDDAGVEDIAETLGMSPADVDSVATFYNLVFRRSVGRHVILLCNSVCCWVVGYEAIYDRLCELLGVEFGGTTEDGRFTLLPVVCLGACHKAPAMMIDDRLHGDLATDSLEEILKQYE